MTLSEGWQGYARIEGMTILDENEQRATSVGWLGLYTLTTPEGGLHFHPDTELTPHLRLELNTSRSGSPRGASVNNSRGNEAGPAVEAGRPRPRGPVVEANRGSPSARADRRREPS